MLFNLIHVQFPFMSGCLNALMKVMRLISSGYLLFPYPHSFFSKTPYF